MVGARSNPVHHDQVYYKRCLVLRAQLRENLAITASSQKRSTPVRNHAHYVSKSIQILGHHAVLPHRQPSRPPRRPAPAADLPHLACPARQQQNGRHRRPEPVLPALQPAPHQPQPARAPAPRRRLRGPGRAGDGRLGPVRAQDLGQEVGRGGAVSVEGGGRRRREKQGWRGKGEGSWILASSTEMPGSPCSHSIDSVLFQNGIYRETDRRGTRWGNGCCRVGATDGRQRAHIEWSWDVVGLLVHAPSAPVWHHSRPQNKQRTRRVRVI
ncbi:hypothetical protein VTK73DRAFT_1818 [Phialemonium thermophilum]|uniref:Uncharacterized protein n=1 Tax=Phialemonium thermophilum TaxID=223376 RepID=A0ABR3VT41_9PEZI